MNYFSKHLKPYKKQLILGPAAKLCEAVFELLIPLMTKSLIDDGIAAGNMGHVKNMAILMGLASVIGFVFALFCQYSASIASQGFGTSLRNALLEKISGFSHRELDSFGTSALITRMTDDVNRLQLAVAMLIRLVIRAPFLCIGGLIMSVYIDARLAIVPIIIVPIFALYLSLLTKKTIPLFNKVQSLLERISLVLRENIAGVRVVRAFAHSMEEKSRFADANRDWQNEMTRAGFISALISPGTFILLNVGSLLVVYLGGQYINIGELTQGDLVALLNYISQVMLALIVIADLAMTFQRAFASMNRITSVLKTESTLEDGQGECAVTEGNSSIEFDNVSFAYVGEAYALSEISFKLESGQTLGVIGGTGSGKSTLLNLLPRFYDPTKGKIKIGGEDIRDCHTEDLRNRIGFVPQKAKLFTGTIESNLRWGKKNATGKELKKALVTAQAADFVHSMPLGVESVVSQGGVNFSGGQKQRLTIARAIVGSPSVVVLDDSASALDYRTDARLRKALKEDLNCTLVIASQRVSAVREADLILVLDQGRVVGKGTHHELRQSCHEYESMCKIQRVEEE